MATRIKSSQIADGAIVAADLHSAIAINTTQSGTFGSVVVDDITIDGSSLTTSGTNDFTVDSGGLIILDADSNGDIRLANSAGQYASLYNSGDHLYLKAIINEGDVYLSGKDSSGNHINALRLDMGNSGRATFIDGIIAGGNVTINSTGGSPLAVHGATAGDVYVQVVNTEAASTTNSSSIEFRGNTSTQERQVAKVTGKFTDITDAARDSRLDFYTFSGGTQVVPLTLNQVDAAFAGDVVITGDLTVEGTQVSLNTTALDVEDKNITLNYHASNDTSASADGAGITIQDAVSQGNDATILWNASSDGFDFSHNVSVENSSGAMIKVDDTNGRFIKIRSANSGSQNANISSYAGLYLGGADNASHMLIANNGDTSFYNDASSNAVKMLWDASHESLSLGDVGSSTDRRLNVSGTGPQTATTQFGVVVNPTMSDDVTGSIYNIYSQANVASGATLTNLYSVYIGSTTLNGSTVTNNYGLYQAGSEKNYFGGNVGIGTTAGSTAKLHVTRTNTHSGNRTIYADGTQLSAITASGTNYLHNVWIENHNFDIDSGVTDSGYRIGLNIEGYHDSNAFEGTLAVQKNIWSRNGNNTNGTGTITNSYNLHLDTLSGGGMTITNNWGLYQTGTGTKNYFAGNLGIGVDPTNAKLEVVSASGEVFRADAASGAYRIIANQNDVLLQGDVGIGTADPKANFQVMGPANASVPAAGSGAVGGAIFSADLNTYGMHIGSITSGKGYIQQQRTDTATYFDLLLQPNGGSVRIGDGGSLQKGMWHQHEFQSFSRTLTNTAGAEEWVRLFEFDNPFMGEVYYGVFGNNFEETGIVEIGTSWTASNLKLNVTRQTYQKVFEEFRLASTTNGANYELWARISIDGTRLVGNPSIRYQVSTMSHNNGSSTAPGGGIVSYYNDQPSSTPPTNRTTTVLDTANNITARKGQLVQTADNGTYSAIFETTSDSQIRLKAQSGTWSGINFMDDDGSENIFYRGSSATFSIGGGGSTTTGKKLHVDGATTIGENFDYEAIPADVTNGEKGLRNGLAVEGRTRIGYTAYRYLNLIGGMNDIEEVSDNDCVIGVAEAGFTELTGTNNTGWMVYRARRSTTAGRSGHAFYTGTTNTARLKILADGSIVATGSFSAASKSFDIEHPTKEGMRLHHGSLEGPEHGVYIRGKLKDGNVIELPEYWTGLVDEDTITVQLTAIGAKQDLWVENVENNAVIVGGENINCFYFIQAERKDVDKFDVEYKE